MSIIIGGTAGQNNDEPEKGLQKVGQMQADCFIGKKNQTLWNGNCWFNFGSK